MKELTIGKVLESLKKELFIFHENSSEFEMNCMERERGLKIAINTCMNQIVEIAEAPGLDSLTKRQQIKSQICFENLSKYADQLINELDIKKIEVHCKELERKGKKPNLVFDRPFDLDTIFLITNSFHTAITTNILWAPDVTVAQAIDISKGKLDLNELGMHLPKVISRINKNLLPYLKTSEFLSEFHPNILESLKCYKKKFYRGCNLITITSIEGMVRKLAIFLAKHHGLSDDFSDEKFNSLNKLLRGVNWKKDLEVDSTELSLIIGENKTRIERKDQNMSSETIKVDLNTRLDFLKARFKDDRDLIMHGSAQDYNTHWNLFLNFSALYETYKVCDYYEKKYGR